MKGTYCNKGKQENMVKQDEEFAGLLIVSVIKNSKPYI